MHLSQVNKVVLSNHPGGSFEVLDSTGSYKPKRFTVAPGGKLSL